MLRIRFHGRGGQGAKTASRIVGTAANLAGFYAQDSPVYGAERRGAPIAAFTRIHKGPILERGVIVAPDVIVVADETLLADPLAGVFVGQEAASAVFVNADSSERVRHMAKFTPPLFVYDVTTLTHERLGPHSALSAGLAGVASKLSGLISKEDLKEATREELSDLAFGEEMVERNIAVALGAYEAVPTAIMEPHEILAREEMREVTYDDPVHGAPEILNTGNAILKKTGNWRVEEPVIDRDACTRCGLCIVLCPDGAIALDKTGYPEIDYEHCKGCMICREICPPNAISTHKEVKAW